MIKVGDKVCLIFNMQKVGHVIEIKEVSPSTWMVGGAMMKMTVATVLYENDEKKEIQVSELMRLDN